MILGILRLIVFIAATALWIPAVILASLADRDARLAFRLAQLWAWLNFRVAGARISVAGLEQLDPNRSYVFVSNHRSNLDVLALVVALWDFQLRWVAKEELFRIPFFGWALRATKQILVNRADHAQAVASLERAKQRMHDGISVVFFPEGTRSMGPTMLPFKKGGFVFALATGAPIVPIGITGTASILPKGSWLPRGHADVRVAVRPPIETAGRSLEERDALLAAVRASIAAAIGEPAPQPAKPPAAAVLAASAARSGASR